MPTLAYFFIIKSNLYVKNSEQIRNFGTHLRKLREENKISQRQLAYMSEIAESTLISIEHGKSSPKLENLISIAKSLDIPMNKLMDFKID